MLVDNLFDISPVEVIDQKLMAQVKINASNSIFEGHFPQNPVTPGVIQIQLVREILELHYGKSLKMDSLGRCKFLAVLNPIDTPSIDVEISVVELDNTYKIKAIGKDQTTSYFKFSAVYS